MPVEGLTKRVFGFLKLPVEISDMDVSKNSGFSIYIHLWHPLANFVLCVHFHLKKNW